MRIGAIDIGTNSMRLLIADIIDNEIVNQSKYINTTRMGQDVDSNGIISKEAIDRNIKALKEFYNKAKEERCQEIYCIGTSALRDAKNGNDFVNRAKIDIGIDIEIISGKKESLLGFRGVLKGIKEKENILVIDIGGGSTEFILGSYDKILFARSENIGALRMTEKFIQNDPVKKEELLEMEVFTKKIIKDIKDYLKDKKIDKVVGIGGTMTSISAMNQELEVYSMDKVHNSKVELKDIDNILQKLIYMTLNDKKTLKGLQAKRADIITAGVKILEIIVKELEIDQITISEYDNLEGLVCKN